MTCFEAIGAEQDSHLCRPLSPVAQMDVVREGFSNIRCFSSTIFIDELHLPQLDMPLRLEIIPAVEGARSYEH